MTQDVVLFDKTPMLAVCDGIYVEPTATAEEQFSLRQSVALAYATVTDFYGTFTAIRPQMILCKTAACRTYFMGTYAGAFSGGGFQLSGATYTAGKQTIFVTYTSFVNLGRETIAHELAHAEFNMRVGGSNFPAWVTEGMATIIGKSPDCSPAYPRYISDLRTLDGGAALATATADSNRGNAIYCQAASEVGAWVTKNGKAKFIDLLSKVKAGESFYSLYGPLLTQ